MTAPQSLIGNFSKPQDPRIDRKRIQPELDREVRKYFEVAEQEGLDGSEIGHEATSEEGHGRIEHRNYFLSTDLSSLVWCGEVEGFESDRDGGIRAP